MHSVGTSIRSWLPLGLAITGTCCLIYITAQQNYRQSLNDPQIQLSEDVAFLLSHGETPSDLISQTVIDISMSLSPFIAVYDESGKLVASSAHLDGKPIAPPYGVLESARLQNGKDSSIAGQNRVTWQPRPGVRSALVVQYFSGTTSGYVVSGRNMREVEIRVKGLIKDIAMAWALLMLATLALRFIIDLRKATSTL